MAVSTLIFGAFGLILLFSVYKLFSRAADPVDQTDRDGYGASGSMAGYDCNDAPGGCD